MKIDFLCPNGSPVGVTPSEIYGRGVGGAELSLLTLVEKFIERGHDVTVYNDPRDGYEHFAPIGAFNPQAGRDALILFRVPYKRIEEVKGRKVFWSCDQLTQGNYKTDIFPYVDKIVTISDFHVKDFNERYDLAVDDPRLIKINLGVRAQDYVFETDVERVKNRLIFCSVPSRGLNHVHTMWPAIKQAVPDASLVITSDFRLWGNGGPGNHEQRLMFMDDLDIYFYGKVKRTELCALQLSADMQFYPCDYNELFCISTAECQYAGAVPITSTAGALVTTNMYGPKIAGIPGSPPFMQEFTRRTIELLTTKRAELEDMRELSMLAARTDFSWDAIVLQWEQLVLQ